MHLSGKVVSEMIVNQRMTRIIGFYFTAINMIDYLTFKTIDELKEFTNQHNFNTTCGKIINIFRDVTDGKWYLIWSI
jgi:hypothetical protein